MADHGVTFHAQYVAKRSRLTTFLRLILAIPHLIFIAVYALVAWLAAIVAWFAIVVTGRYPDGLYRFAAGFLRYQARLLGYLNLLTDAYPPFNGSVDVGYPVDLHVPPAKPRYSRLKTLLRSILAIPVALIAWALGIVAQVGALIAWFAIVILGRQPAGLQEMTALGTSYYARATAYYLLVTEDWPAFSDDDAAAAAMQTGPVGALSSGEPARGVGEPGALAEPPPARPQDRRDER